MIAVKYRQKRIEQWVPHFLNWDQKPLQMNKWTELWRGEQLFQNVKHTDRQWFKHWKIKIWLLRCYVFRVLLIGAESSMLTEGSMKWRLICEHTEELGKYLGWTMYQSPSYWTYWAKRQKLLQLILQGKNLAENEVSANEGFFGRRI